MSSMIKLTNLNFLGVYLRICFEPYMGVFHRSFTIFSTELNNCRKKTFLYKIKRLTKENNINTILNYQFQLAMAIDILKPSD